MGMEGVGKWVEWDVSMIEGKRISLRGRGAHKRGNSGTLEGIYANNDASQFSRN